MPLLIDPAAPVQTTARDLVIYLASGEVTYDGLRMARTWLGADPAHQAAFERERALWQGLQQLQPQFAKRPPTTAPALPKPVVRPRHRIAIAASLLAASLLLVLGAEPLLLLWRTDYRTAPGEQRLVSLPDGSSIRLNTASAIAVRYSGSVRQIDLLRGEALFEVAPDAARPFLVAAQNGSAQALGTAFTMREQHNGVSVAVTKGLVGVASPTSGVVLRIGPGQAAHYAPGFAPQALSPAATAAATAWLQGSIRIDGLPLQQALAELERYIPGRILLLPGAGKAEQPVSGTFAIGRADDAIAALAATHDLSVTRLSPHLTILR